MPVSEFTTISNPMRDRDYEALLSSDSLGWKTAHRAQAGVCGIQTDKGSLQGERGGVHPCYTATCVFRCRFEMLALYKGRIYDPACCSGGISVQSAQFVESGFNPVLLAA
jgi:hypothetical protein